MQMQKKITHKEDGRFLVYYHFPDTATPEETAVFEGIEAMPIVGRPLADKHPTPEHPTPNTGGVSHV